MTALSTPVLLIIFNRPDLVRLVWEVIRAARPSRLFLVADGPRADHPQDVALCAGCRAIVEQVDWPCQVERNYAEINLGCDPRIASGITWVFSRVEEAIILEDDILPNSSFFPFCQTLLARYRDDERVMGIGGFNLLGQWRNDTGDYHLHRRITTWGWATWRRAWQHHEYGLDTFDTAEVSQRLSMYLSDSEQIEYLSQIFNVCSVQPAMPWDAQWTLICNLMGGLWVSPRTNLVANLGFDASATHTTNADDLRRFVQRGSVPAALAFPADKGAETADDQFDRWLFLLEVLNTYRHIRGLHLWQRVLAEDPDRAMPGVPGGGRAFLAPLRDPAELLAVLDYVTPFMVGNPRLHHLRDVLTAMVQSG
jgi:hypothetical protein